MANYNVQVVTIRKPRGGSLEETVKNYINSLDVSKVIRAVCLNYEGNEPVCLLIHDA